MPSGSEKIEKILRAVATDVGTIKRDVAEVRVSQARQLRDVYKVLGDMQDDIHQLRSDQATVASSVAVAISQLALAQSVMKRLDRLEAAVFPTKH